ncbi:MAG: glycoside hydrolase family 2 TIM barrel-domain containing protein [Eubacteriales bacterium]|nr:glycoside hydrolase family 2 TIM barrel-domain containing protein [Eubacteriales bacterium]
MIVPKHYENLSVLHEGTMPDRAYYIPAGQRMECLTMNREASDRIQMLGGTWQFRYYDSIYDLRDTFYETDYDAAGFDEIPVPGVWQNYGYDRHQYTNIRYPFPADPPYVPPDNPCGAYIHHFFYEKNEDAPRSFLVFEGVDSCFYVWLNGIYIGYSQVSHAQAEFEITDALREGENVLAVLVLKWCDGSYLEDQDKLRMSGIFRDVYLLRRPKQCVFDYFINTEILWRGESEEADSAKIDLRVSYLDRVIPVRAMVLDAAGREVARFAFEGSASFTIPSPRLWNSEDPYLYTLFLETAREVIAERIGIREVTVRGNVLLINRKPVKFRGVNRHDSDPVTGPVVSISRMRRDLHEDYIRPQENGSHCDCDYVTLCDNSYSLTAYSTVPFSFNASVYTQEELTAKAHNYELEPCGSTVLCLDVRQNGIGSNSCGPRLQEKYRFDDAAFTYDMCLLPAREVQE